MPEARAAACGWWTAPITVLDVDAASCGGEGGAAVQAIDAVARPVIAAIDDWDELTSTD